MSSRRYLEYYRAMLLIRRFEEQVETLFARGVITGTAHCCIGQEATAVGVCGALRAEDRVTSTHRGHGHFLARGGDPRRVMAELFGKSTGYSGGRGGSQFMASYELGFLGGNGITGGSLALAVGVALSGRLRHAGGVTVCFFGDGATNQGAFHESLNMAAVWKLPVLFVCENNLYAMSTRTSDVTAAGSVADRASAYGMPGTVVDGNDVLAVYDATKRARKRAVSGYGPILLECRTYRLCGHSRGDPRVYRTDEEERRWSGRDPVSRFGRNLIAQKIVSRGADTELRREIEDVIEDAVRFAEMSPYPDPATLTDGVYA